MLKIGLTGGIGSGKSTVARIFEVLSIPVYYADEAARRLMNEHQELKNQIRELFGEAAYIDGQLNRAYIGGTVFSDAGKLARLNAIVHPKTREDAAAWMRKQHASYAIKEAALIFEAGLETGLDQVIGVTAPVELRIARVMKRDGVPREKVLERMNRQMDEKEKMKRCDFIIENDERTPLLPQVLKIHDTLMKKSAVLPGSG